MAPEEAEGVAAEAEEAVVIYNMKPKTVQKNRKINGASLRKDVRGQTAGSSTEHMMASHPQLRWGIYLNNSSKLLTALGDIIKLRLHQSGSFPAIGT